MAGDSLGLCENALQPSCLSLSHNPLGEEFHYLCEKHLKKNGRSGTVQLRFGRYQLRELIS